MTRYFKTYIDRDKDIEISKAKALEHLARVYKRPDTVLRCMPIGYKIKVGCCWYKKVRTE